MQTFLPYPDFKQTAEVLDNRRLGCQVKEVKQIYDALHNGKGWKNHPAVKMWAGYEEVLLLYGHELYLEYTVRFLNGRRGGKPFHKSGEEISTILGQGILKGKRFYLDYKSPWWLGDEQFHSAHRAALLYKSNWYAQFGWNEIPELSYLWPKQDGTFQM